MQCPVCAATNPDLAAQCAKCQTPLSVSPQETLNEGGSAEAWSVAVSAEAAGRVVASDELEVGTLLAGRYEIIQLLGRGGMGAVYKARDAELDRVVALKLIRPELARNPEVLSRFKQELILARQVTHRNVIRIFDLGQSDGIKFITMDFVEGQNLHALLLERGKFPPEQAARVMLQICRALEAAHGEGVIHRDLKPQNIMISPDRRVYVMDFGIARSAHLPGMTQTGALIGTPEYMSPEQARGEKLTERSDLFSLGVIFYELLTAKSPYPADAPLGTLWKRLQEKPKAPVEVDPSVPKPLNDIVMSALEIEPEKRMSSAGEMARQLEVWLGPSAGSSTIIVPASRTAHYWKWASAALAVLLITGVIALRLRSLSKPKAAQAAVSVLVADFTNHTGDPIFDNTLEPMFNVALEGASFINAFNRGNARKLAGQLPHPTDKLDEQPARLVAVSQGIGAVITGELSRRGDKYSLSATALDAESGNVIAKSEVTVANKDGVLLTIPKLAAPIRKALGDTTPESAQLNAAAGAFTAASLEVVHDYGVGMEQQFAGNMQGALQSFSKAVELDANFARAYAGIASAYRNLGDEQDAEKYVKLAMEHVDRMTERERYRIRGLYYVYTGDFPKCIEEYTSLVNLYPSDNLAHNNLAKCYIELHNYPKAIDESQRALKITPNAAFYRMNLSVLFTYTGDFPAAEEQARTVIRSNPSFEVAYVALAYSQLGQGQLTRAAETYQKLEKLSSLGASMASSGLADLAIYEGRFSDAVRLLESGAAADLAAKNSRAAEKIAMLASTQLWRGRKGPALEAAARAVASSKKVNVRFLMARVFVEEGEVARARALATELASELSAEAQADSKLIQGEAALKENDARTAIQLFTEANKLLDTWMGRFDLGRAYLEAGLYVQASSEFDRCINGRGEAMDLLDGPTYGYFPPVYYYLGRTEEGLGSSGAANSYWKFVSIQEKGDGGPLLQDAKKRLADLTPNR
jgi:tetratricopeptide (TPR) repeat protein/predicted Ser/Thr protein kinase